MNGAGPARDRKIVEDELRREVEQAKAEYHRATGVSQSAARERYVRALDGFSRMLLGERTPDFEAGLGTRSPEISGEPMDAALDLIMTQLNFARTMLQLVGTAMNLPANAEGATRAIDHARTSLEVARKLSAGANLSEMERAAISHALLDLEAKLYLRG
jgi:hypothetical protein